MGDVKPSTYLYGVVMFTFMILAGVYFLNQMGFGENEDFQRFNETFNKFDNLNSSIGELEEGVTDASTRTGTLGVINSLIDSVWNSILLWFDSFGFMDAVFEGLATFFGLPAWIHMILSMLITIVLVFAIYRLLFQADA